MTETLTNVQLREITRITKSILEAGDILEIDPVLMLNVIEDLYWARLQERENHMYLQECQDIIKDITELADWESDEWDAVERLGKIRKRLGVEN